MKPVKKIRQMKCEVCSLCQNDCAMCAHGEQRKTLPDYQLSLEELHTFLKCSEDSGYYIDNMRIHGPGEPLLWRHFNEGVKMMKASGIIGSIFVATNGLLLKNISNDALDCIDEMRVSVYSSFNCPDHDTLHNLVNRFPRTTIVINKPDEFRRLPVIGEEAAIPCRCICDGPMLFGNRVFLYCGPPVFAATKKFGENACDDNELSVSASLDWFDAYNKKKAGNMEYCKCCWANGNFALDSIPHDTNGGNWR